MPATKPVRKTSRKTTTSTSVKKKAGKKKSAKKASAGKQKSAAPSRKALEAKTQEFLTTLLIAVLQSAPLRKRAGISLKGLDEVSLGCDVDFIQTAQMKKLNAKYRKKNSDTDVLSFPAPDVFRRQGILGEILISLPVLMRQAKEHAHPWQNELAVLLTHGVLHLLDFDHERGARDAREMHSWEKKLLKAPGLISRSSS